MATDTKVANLIINKGLTKAELNEKYQQGLIGDNELSIVDTEEDVVQVDEMPTASAANVNSIVQYAGATTEDYTQGYFYKNVPEYSDPTATISQTVGSGLTDLAVDVDTFIETEQPTGNETVDFVASVTPATLSFVPQATWSVSATPEQLKSMYLNEASIDLDSLAPAEQQNLLVEYYNENNVGFGFSGSTYINLSVTALGNYGITITGTPVDNESTTGVYTPQVIDWEKDSSTVDIASYGISFNGTVSDGDTLTVVYTATYISEYNWTQINVQPGGGGGAGIDWKTIVDLPATYSSGTYLDCPQFIVQGGLPDGNYEFYYQVKTRSNSGDQTAPFGVATYKIIARLYHENEWPYMVGSIASVIDGEWIPSSSYKLYNHTVYGCFFEDSGNFVIWGSDYPFVSDLGDLPNTSAPGCFKLSAIKNTDTGDEYIATGIEPNGQQPYFAKQYGGSLYMDTIQAEPSIPSYFYTSTLNYGGWYFFSGNYITINKGLPSCCSEFDLSLVSSNGGRWHIIAENTPDSYKINLLEASGDLANVQIGYNELNNIFLYINTPSGTTGTVNVFVGIKGAAQTTTYISSGEQPTNFTQFTLNTVGGDISTSNYGSILQYTGTTNANYTNGYFYKANGTQTIVQASIDCNEISSYGTTITCNDIDGLINAISTYTGWTKEYVSQRLGGVSEWQGIQQTGYLYWNQWGSFGENSSILNYFDFTGGTQTEYDTIQWITANYSPTHTVITNPSWDRVDVQPAADPLPSQAGNAGKFLITNGTNTSWSTSITYPMSIINTSESNPTTMLTLGVGSSSGNYFGIMTFSTLTRADLLLGGNSVLELRRQNLTPVSDNSFSLGYTGQQWKNIYTYKLNNGADITIPTVGGIMMLQTPTLPTASSTLEGQIYQFVGTTDANYTNGHFYKCVSDGADPATYSWTEVSTGSGSSYTAGTGIDITNNAISVDSTVLVNNPTGTSSVNIKGSNNNQSNSVAVGSGATVTNNQGIAVGWGSQAGYDCTAVGAGSVAYDDYSVAIGFGATVPYGVAYAIQLGNGTNNTSGTLAVALSANGSSWTNYELLSSDGTIPEARLADTTNAAQGQVLTLDANLNAVWQAGGSGGGLPSQTGNAGKFLTTDGTDASWATISALQNTATQPTSSLAIEGNAYNTWDVAIGKNSTAYKTLCVAIGGAANSYSVAGVAIGNNSGTFEENSGYFIAIGYQAVIGANAKGAIQIGKGTNSTAGTMSVGLTTDGSSWANYELLSSDGTIPAARHASLPSADGTYVLKLVISGGVPTLSWVAE